MSFHRSGLVLIVTVVLAAGCASTRGQGARELEQGARREGRAEVRAPRLHVKNFNWSDVRLYAIRSGARFRIGIISSMGEEVFELPASVAGGGSGFTLLADPLPSGHGYMTGMIQVSPDQLIELTLENNINLSNYSIW
jgi:hypothetical protein